MWVILWHLQFYGRSIGHMDTCEVLSKLIDFILRWCNTRWNFALHSVSHSAPWSGSFKFFLLCVYGSQRSVFCLCLVVSLILHLYASCFTRSYHFVIIFVGTRKKFTDLWTKRQGSVRLEFNENHASSCNLLPGPKN